jgi:hypothetical protein
MRAGFVESLKQGIVARPDEATCRATVIASATLVHAGSLVTVAIGVHATSLMGLASATTDQVDKLVYCHDYWVVGNSTLFPHQEQSAESLTDMMSH